jgi:hypothetical protein
MVLRLELTTKSIGAPSDVRQPFCHLNSRFVITCVIMLGGFRAVMEAQHERFEGNDSR